MAAWRDTPCALSDRPREGSLGQPGLALYPIDPRRVARPTGGPALGADEARGLEVRVGGNDRAQALFRALVAAIGVGVVDLHQGFVGTLDLVGFSAGLEAQRLEGAPIVLVQLDGALGLRAARGGAAVFRPDVQRIGEA